MIFTKKFWATTLEAVIATAASTFAGSLVITSTPTLKGLIAALTASGISALYVFAKALGGSQAVAATKPLATPATPKPTTV